MTIYISGPMTGVAKNDFPMFNDTAKRLRDIGFDVANPVANALKAGGCQKTRLRSDIAMLVECDSIVLVGEWRKDPKTKLEYQIAEALGLKVYTLCDLFMHL